MRPPTTRPFAESLINPHAIAIVGASDNPKKTTARPQQFLQRAGYRGNAYFINPTRDTVQGAKAWPTLSSLPEVPEHVYIMTGAEAAIAAVRECAHLGVPVATVLSAGFAEDGPVGQDREDRLRAAAAEGPTRVIGPSSLGVVNPRTGVMLTGNAAFGEPNLPAGGVFVASQSGSVIGSLLSRALGRGIGFAGLVSTGGEADLSLGSLCEAMIADPGVTSFALFLESLRHAEDLAAFARAAAEAGKPVAVYKLGRSDEAAALAVSHTGALAGEDSEADAFFRACGFARIYNFESLVEAPALLERIPATAPTTPRVGVITTTGGGAAIMVDQLALRGLNIVGPSANLVARMAEAEVIIPHSLIADLGLDGARHDIVTNALTLMQDSGEFDVIVFVIGSSARLNPELAVQAIAERGNHAVPIVASALPEAPEAAALLNSSGVPAFRTPESCADVVAAAFSRRPTTVGDTAQFAANAAAPAQTLDEQASAALLGRLGVTFPESVAVSVQELEDVSISVEFPAVVKVLSDQLPHKSDVGGVVLNVADITGVREAARTIVRNVAAQRSAVTVDRVLVQQMARKGIAEALIGYRVSRDVGPMVVLSTGGVLAEIFADTSVRLAPVTIDVAHEMIREVKGLAVITGYRGLPEGDVDALASTIVAMSRLAVTNTEVLEAEINPVSIGAKGCGVLALDALVSTSVSESVDTRRADAALAHR
ncbi:6-carboxyhexanoate--CoA ligase [Mycolicibacterium mageritense DSM 44476 = CIP 104973]|uniref:6-carboxyhexanoate--CoA ligase n=1 Tax=Mycolicibacterium mageritense TaxID=53462 RepID=A0ABM7I443_MYCME|nr:acetate--CoA ligase family protein [Mycolicibacterium mageritense]MCC9180426.1 acetate--CoA ligase family protein [Mycolicibacterium mageritense]BBX37673.1 6-carboxyhexanoate--CoA ligase [Mycolicibacterium mageritense]CDO25662.1 CoA-binding domain-containing protein [Mycolicibacterium mageritense DSM 44476 = CIP 104973]